MRRVWYRLLNPDSGADRVVVVGGLAGNVARVVSAFFFIVNVAFLHGLANNTGALLMSDESTKIRINT